MSQEEIKKEEERQKADMLRESSLGYGLEGALPEYISVLKGIGTDYRPKYLKGTKYDPVFEGIEIRFTTRNQSRLESLTLAQARELRDILNAMELREIHNQDPGNINRVIYEYKNLGQLFWEAFPVDDPEPSYANVSKFFGWLNRKVFEGIVLLPFTDTGAYNGKWDISFSVVQADSEDDIQVLIDYNTEPSASGNREEVAVSLQHAFRWVAMVATTMDVYKLVRGTGE